MAKSPDKSKDRNKDPEVKPVTPRKMRRSRGFEPVADRLPGLTDQILRKRGFVKSEIIRQWQDIAGPELGPLCQPMEIRFPGLAARDGILTLRASGAAAPLIDMEAPRLIERINQFYGYKAIARLKIAQSARKNSPPSTHKSGLAGLFGDEKAPEPRLSEAQKTELSNRLKDIEDPELRAALAGLGEKILVDK
ncbi:MAG: DciA family protein [Alphaproteobacteria bacterium]